MLLAFRFAIATFLGFLACCIVSATSAADTPATLPAAIQTFLKQHCLECHGSDAQESGLRYDGIMHYRTEDTHLWTMVHQKLSAGEMPPKDSARPTAAETETVLKWIEIQQQATATSSLRRLNRRELAAALRDVTGLAVDYAQGLPGDRKVAGFDTGADGLHDAADSVAQIMTVTRRAVDGIRFLGDSPARYFPPTFAVRRIPKKRLTSGRPPALRRRSKAFRVLASVGCYRHRGSAIAMSSTSASRPRTRARGLSVYS
jgi:mono/diheme cytochrome c family protein